MLDDAEVEKAQPDSTGKTADTEIADKVDSAAAVADSSEVLAISKEPAEVAMSDDKLEDFFQGLKSETQPHSQQCGSNWSATCRWQEGA